MRISLLLLGLCSLLGCSNADSAKGMGDLKTVSEDGLAQTQIVGDYAYTARYLPISQQALKEVDFRIKDTTVFRKIVRETEGHHYLSFQIAPAQKGKTLQALYENKPTELEWAQVQSAMNFHYQKQFELAAEETQYACKLYQAYPGINTDLGIQFILVFKDELATINQDFATNLTFTFLDLHFNQQPIEFAFAKSDLNNIPKLKF